MDYIKEITQEIAPEYDEFELAIMTYKDLFDELINKVRSAAKARKKDFYDIIEALQYKMNDVWEDLLQKDRYGKR